MIDRTCEACGNLLIQREKERPGRFASRRFCSRRCVADSHRNPPSLFNPDPDRDKAVALIDQGYCPYCEKGPYRVVAGHVWRAHRIGTRELRDQFEIPYRESICDPEHAELMADMMRRENRVEAMKGKSPEGRRGNYGPGATRAQTLNGKRAGERRRRVPREDYPIIRKRLDEGETYKAIGSEYGVTGAAISQCMRLYELGGTKFIELQIVV